MKRILFLIISTVVFFGCDNASNRDQAAIEEADHNDRQRYDEFVNNDGNYEFTGTAPERKTAFDRAASDLESNIKKLKASTTDNDVIEKLNEVQEKIDEAREKAVKADEKIASNQLEDAEEKIDEAREKLDEAREKYEDALEKINSVN